MKNKVLLLVLFTITLFLQVACDSSTDESSVPSNQESTIDLNEHVDEVPNTDVASTENTSSSDDNTELNKDNPTDTSVKPDNKPPKNNDSAWTQKNEYLQKLNEINQDLIDKFEGAKTIAIEEVQERKFEVWDEALNEIYGVLMEQLASEEMENLKEEKRNWVITRDEKAKEASQKFEGGTMESIEYVATQASLTKERCYELVQNYMR